MNSEEFMRHWNYYLMLEEDLKNTQRYVEHCEDNCSTYSNEFAKIILLTCSEIEVILKKFGTIYVPTKALGNMKEYKENMLKSQPYIVKATTYIPYFSGCCPFEGWESARLSWWDDYTSIKHNRTANFSKATLWNSIETLSALLVLLNYLKHELEDFLTNPEICNLRSKYIRMGYFCR